MKWYENDVRLVEQKIGALPYDPETLFYGSSSFRLWHSLYDDFKAYAPLNMGFGGSTLEACVHFFPRMMKRLKPSYLLVYAGDNDLGDGKSPEMVLNYFFMLNTLVRNQFGDIPYTYISVKPSLSRWNITDKIKLTNSLIMNAISSMDANTNFLDIYHSMLDARGLPDKTYYEKDGLHLSPRGYGLWKEIMASHISSLLNGKSIKC